MDDDHIWNEINGIMRAPQVPKPPPARMLSRILGGVVGRPGGLQLGARPPSGPVLDRNTITDYEKIVAEDTEGEGEVCNS
jgi:hypothetical protein